MKVGVTGTVASGKSSVCQILKKQGAHVVSADNIVHKYLTPTTTIGKDIIKLLGPDIVVDGAIDKEKMAQKVFNNPSLLSEVEGIIHPKVIEEIHQESKAHPFFVAEIPLLFECHLENEFDVTLAVLAPKETRQRRFAKSQTTFEKREERMLSSEEKRARADYVIENNGSLDELKNQVNQFIQTIRGKDANGH